MSTTPALIVSGPANVPYPHGLFGAVFQPTPESPEWEAFGVEYPSFKVDASTYANECLPDTHPSRPLQCRRDWRYTAPFTVEVSSGLAAVHADGEAATVGRDALIVSEQVAVEARLWAELIADGDGVPAVATSAAVLAAVAHVEQEAAKAYGGTPVLHMSRSTATSAVAAGVVSLQSGQLRTLLGSRVVAGAGYANGHVVGTGALLMLRGEIVSRDAVLDTETNTHSALAQRTYLIGWDGVRQRATTA